jgi:hypothetical protein
LFASVISDATTGSLTAVFPNPARSPFPVRLLRAKAFLLLLYTEANTHKRRFQQEIGVCIAPLKATTEGEMPYNHPVPRAPVLNRFRSLS